MFLLFILLRIRILFSSSETSYRKNILLDVEDFEDEREVYSMKLSSSLEQRVQELIHFDVTAVMCTLKHFPESIYQQTTFSLALSLWPAATPLELRHSSFSRRIKFQFSDEETFA